MREISPSLRHSRRNVLQLAAASYKRNGTAILFAALNTVNGKIIGLCQERHRHQEWIYFLRLVDQATPDNKATPSHRGQLCHAHIPPSNAG
jgi:hypothetical protein